MQVFIENEAESSIKNIFNEKTLEYVTSRKVSAPYPFPYGFLPNTTSGDGDNVDCFVITDTPLESKQMVEIEVLGLLKVHEDDEVDHKVIARLKGESQAFTRAHRDKIEDFIHKVFAHIPGKKMEIGRLLDSKEAIDFIEKSQDKL